MRALGLLAALASLVSCTIGEDESSPLTISSVAAENCAIGALKPDAIPVDETSLHCIGLRWIITGDANANATVAVTYRKAGTEKWHSAMPLRRVENAALEDRKPPEGTTILAGSIFWLSPDTDYEVELALSDPDGGSCRRQITRRTLAEPVWPEQMRVVHVAPGRGGGMGTATRPFKGLTEASEQSRPGDLMLLAPGVYKGPLRVVNDGAPKAPIVWRSGPGGQAIIEGPANGTAIVAKKRKYIFFEGLAIRGAAQAIAVDGAEYLTIRRCMMTEIDKGINDDALAHRLFISDNVLKGTHVYGQKLKRELRGIELSGSGHVICYNRVSGFRDGIDTRMPWPVRDVDIHNNDVSECQDDGIELDFSEHNVRAYENRITNCPMGISYQPSRGGPNYAIRNILYNIRGECFKLHLTPTNRKAPNWKVGPHRTSGGVILHNTVVKKDTPLRVWSDEGPVNYFYARNNLFVGSPAHASIDIGPPMRYADFDYNAYVAEQSKMFANWNEKRYQTIDAFREATGLETHGMMLKKFAGIFADSVMLPTEPNTAAPISRNAPLLAAGSLVIDKGQVLANINDDFKGKAPDIGAWEYGAKPPHYGPRPKKNN